MCNKKIEVTVDNLKKYQIYTLMYQIYTVMYQMYTVMYQMYTEDILS